MSTAEPGSATVRVTVSSDDGAVLPVQLRRPSMVVAARGLTGEAIEVEPGAYLATTVLPGGAELVSPVEVGRGEARTVELAVPAPSGSASAGAGAFAADGEAGTPRTVYLRLLGGDPFAPPLRTIGAARVRVPGDGARSPDGALPALPEPSVPDSRPDPYRFRTELALPTGDADRPVRWLRIDAPPDPVLVTAVPALPGGSATLGLARPRGEGRFLVDFTLPDPELDALLHFRQAGDARQARALLDADLLVRAGDSAVSRVVAAYAVLRLGAGGTPHLLPDSWFAEADPALPDVGVCEGERRARLGDHEGARSAFAAALRTGLPMFSNGLGYLSSRIPQYLRSGPARYTGEGDAGDDLAALWARLVPFVRVADLKQAVLSLRADVLAYLD